MSQGSDILQFEQILQLEIGQGFDGISQGIKFIFLECIREGRRRRMFGNRLECQISKISTEVIFAYSIYHFRGYFLLVVYQFAKIIIIRTRQFHFKFKKFGLSLVSIIRILIFFPTVTFSLFYISPLFHIFSIKFILIKSLVKLMGPKQSTTSEPVDLYMDHPIFKNAKSISVDGQNYMEALMGTQEKQYKKWKDTLEKAKVARQFLLLPVKDQYSSKGLCSSSGTLSLKFESFPYLLSEQIINRKGKKKNFQECQIWYLLYSLACAKKDMVPVFSKIGDVRPQNIFINEKGEIKVSNRYSWPHEATNYQKVIDGQTTYVAPQQLKHLEVAGLENEDSDKSQIFSIGLTLLATALHDNFNKLYNIKKYQFDVQQFRNSLAALNSSPAFSDILKGTINNLAELNPEKRLTPAELWTWISQYENKILSKQNFVINQAPDKLHQQVAQIRQAYGTHSSYIQSSPPPPMEHTSPVMTTSGFSGQKLNFPPPVIRSNLMVQGFPGGPVRDRIPNAQNNGKSSQKPMDQNSQKKVQQAPVAESSSPEKPQQQQK